MPDVYEFVHRRCYYEGRGWNLVSTIENNDIFEMWLSDVKFKTSSICVFYIKTLSLSWKIRHLRLVYCSQHVAQWYEDHNGMYICVALVAPVNEWIYMTIAMCCLRHAHLVLVVLCQIWWFALYMSAQLIYAHQGCTWAMLPTSWHQCWNDNPTCLCAFPQRPALSQHMASVDCRVMHGCQACAQLVDCWFFSYTILGRRHAVFWDCMHVFTCTHIFTHTHVHDSRCVCVHSHMYMYVYLLKPGLCILCLFF